LRGTDRQTDRQEHTRSLIVIKLCAEDRGRTSDDTRHAARNINVDINLLSFNVDLSRVESAAEAVFNLLL